MNRLCSHLNSFCATSVGSSLATIVTFTCVPRGGWESVLQEGRPASNFIFVPQYMAVAGMRFEWYNLYLNFLIKIIKIHPQSL